VRSSGDRTAIAAGVARSVAQPPTPLNVSIAGMSAASPKLRPRLRLRILVPVATCFLLALPVAAAQQVFPPNGLLFDGDVGRPHGRSYLEVQTHPGALNTISFRIKQGVRLYLSLAKPGRRVGELEILNSDSRGRRVALTIPHHLKSSDWKLTPTGSPSVTLHRRSPAGSSRPVFSISHLPAGATDVTLSLTSRGGPLLTSGRCPSTLALSAHATRVGAPPATSRFSSGCF
jgi:hypothetical protein